MRTTDQWRADRSYPRPGARQCEILNRSKGEAGLDLAFGARLSLDFIESPEALSELTVRAALAALKPE